MSGCGGHLASVSLSLWRPAPGNKHEDDKKETEKRDRKERARGAGRGQRFDCGQRSEGGSVPGHVVNNLPEAMTPVNPASARKVLSCAGGVST